MRTFVIGDIHGALKALRQCWERSGFNEREDRLILLGDVCDGYPEVRGCIDALLGLRRCDLIRSNHDAWALDWAVNGLTPEIWISQGGDNTLRSYDEGPMPKEHIAFLKRARPWLETDGRLFVHGGFDPDRPLSEQSDEIFLWDRSFLAHASQMHRLDPSHRFGGYEAVFLGHTPTGGYGSSKPLRFCNVWALDTGAGWSGPLTLMDVETKEYWQSDPTPKLYGFAGRH